MDRILVTGATGNVGIEIVKALIQKGGFPVAAVRKNEKDKSALPDGIELVEFEFGKTDTYKAALQGIKKVFLMRPPAISDVKATIFPFVDEAVKAGVEHIVLLSLMGAEQNPVVPHRKLELYLLEKKIPYTFLRPSFFMQNISTTHRDEVRLNNEIFVPAGKGKTSFIDCRDIAEIGAKVLLEPGHLYKAYELSGNEALSYYDAAEVLSEVLERKIEYKNPGILRFYIRMRQKGIPVAFVLVMIALYSVCRFGWAAKVTNESESLLGRKPITFRQFANDYKSNWI